jgi:drug/metabolite transporter (DMT)-like permease
MVIAIVLALAASFCTATASICQRLGARSLQARDPGAREHEAGGFDPLLVFRLARRPVWLVGFACMIGGFAFQISALRFGPLALVQPVLAVELLIVFGYLAVLTRFKGVRWRELVAAAAMSAGISVFLRAASPSGGRPHAPAGLWWLAGLVTLAVVGLAVAAAGFGPGRSPSRRAAFLGIATGVAWGFVAAVIKEMSSHLAGGPQAVFTNWSVYVLIVAGSASMLLASHAMTAGPLAASQPGFTLLDPVVSILLGVFLFGERLQTSAPALTAEVIGLCVLAVGVSALSRSPLITSSAAATPPGQTGTSRSHSALAEKSR